jgi:membrane protein DedA with SNARE-associated domain
MLESLLTDYGYPILVIGTFLEGETVMLLGGVFAHLGYLSLEGVIACGFCGTLLGDQLFFFLGRRHGKGILARHPTWQPGADRVFRKLEQHQNLLILGFRFLYGLRTVTPLAIGMSGVSYLRFTLLNMSGAALWAIGTGLAGYFFGQAIGALVGDIKHYELELTTAIAGIGVFIWMIHLFRRRRSTLLRHEEMK